MRLPIRVLAGLGVVLTLAAAFSDEFPLAYPITVACVVVSLWWATLREEHAIDLRRREVAALERIGIYLDRVSATAHDATRHLARMSGGRS